MKQVIPQRFNNYENSAYDNLILRLFDDTSSAEEIMMSVKESS
jgi:hypothetical protein